MGQQPAVADLLREYRDTLLAMHECRVLTGGDPRQWNRLVNQMQSVHLQLRQSSQGRDGITSLIDDECVTVRQWSATNALAWAPGQARAELTREVEEGGPAAFEARVALREFDAGRLNTAWKPKA